MIDMGGDDFGVPDGVLLGLVHPGVQGGHINVFDLLAQGLDDFVV